MKRLIPLIAALALLVIAQPGQAQSGSFSDVLIEQTDPTYFRPGDNCGAVLDEEVHYQTQQFTVTETGEYDLRFSQSGIPTAAAIYTAFNPSNPTAGCVDSDGPITNPLVLPRIVTTLEAGVTYTLVKSCRFGEMPCYWFYQTYFGPGNLEVQESDDSGDDSGDDSSDDSNPASDDGPSFPTDDRVEQPFLDKVALYNRPGPDGQPALHIYCIGENSQGFITQAVTADEVADNLEAVRNTTARPGSAVVEHIFIYRERESACPYEISLLHAQYPESEPQLILRIRDLDQRKSHFLILDGIPLTEILSFQTNDW